MSSTGSDGGGDDYAEFLRVFESVPFANEYTLASNHNDLTFEEEQTLSHYALGAYASINTHLRGTSLTTEVPSEYEIDREIAVIRSALLKSPLVEAVRVSREVDGLSIGVTDEASAIAAVGGAFDELGFMSTSMTKHPPSLVPAHAYPVTLELLVPAGTPARALGELSYFSEHEKELLIIDGQTVQIDFARYDETAGRWRLLGRIG
jgi:ADP-ribosyltransferase exoenzyme